MSYSLMTKRGKIVFNLFAAFAFVVTVGCVFYVNLIIPFMMDDEWYATKLSMEEPIKSAKDIVGAQIWHYFNWGGRSITHSMLQFVILAGENVADIVNTVMVVITGIVVTLLTETMTRIKRTFSERLMCTDIVMGLCLGLNANWEMSMFWQSGACNYLYITVFILLFMWVYMREIPYDCFGSKEPLWGVSVWIIPLALIAGWSNENMGPVAFIFSIATIIYVRKVNHIVEPWMILGSVFSFIGSAACILAPGNFVRSSQVENTQYGIFWKSYLHCFFESKAAFEFLFPTLMVVLAIVGLFKAVNNEALGREVVYVLALAVLSWGAMVLSPHYPDRATYGTMVLAIVACVALCQRLFEKRATMRETIYIGAVFIWLRGMYFLTSYFGVWKGWIL